MKFDLTHLQPNTELQVVDGSKGRYYTTPEGNAYPSVTTILSATAKKQWLSEWRARVGMEEADRVSGVARTRGHVIHKLCEDYILGRDLPEKIMPINLQTFNQFRRELDTHLGSVYCVEAPLYSHLYKVAGRCDLIAQWDNDFAIIDHKTSSGIKTIDDVEDYFIQKSIYNICYGEHNPIQATKLVSIIGCDDSLSAIVFVRDFDEYFPKALERIENYYDSIRTINQ